MHGDVASKVQQVAPAHARGVDRFSGGAPSRCPAGRRRAPRAAAARPARAPAAASARGRGAAGSAPLLGLEDLVHGQVPADVGPVAGPPLVRHHRHVPLRQIAAVLGCGGRRESRGPGQQWRSQGVARPRARREAEGRGGQAAGERAQPALQPARHSSVRLQSAARGGARRPPPVARGRTCAAGPHGFEGRVAGPARSNVMYGWMQSVPVPVPVRASGAPVHPAAATAGAPTLARGGARQRRARRAAATADRRAPSPAPAPSRVVVGKVGQLDGLLAQRPLWQVARAAVGRRELLGTVGRDRGRRGGAGAVSWGGAGGHAARGGRRQVSASVPLAASAPPGEPSRRRPRQVCGWVGCRWSPTPRTTKWSFPLVRFQYGHVCCTYSSVFWMWDRQSGEAPAVPQAGTSKGAHQGRRPAGRPPPCSPARGAPAECRPPACGRRRGHRGGGTGRCWRGGAGRARTGVGAQQHRDVEQVRLCRVVRPHRAGQQLLQELRGPGAGVERGHASAIHVFHAGGPVLRLVPSCETRHDIKRASGSIASGAARGAFSARRRRARARSAPPPPSGARQRRGCARYSAIRTASRGPRRGHPARTCGDRPGGEGGVCRRAW